MSHHYVIASHDQLLIKHSIQVSTALTEIHGQHPVPIDGILEGLFPKRTPQQDRDAGHIVVVPQSMAVVGPLLHRPDSKDKGIRQPSEMGLSCNYSVLKATAAIMQTLYASFGLYQVSGAQIKKFGYASYSLTVIPYILMSLINLLATLCQPNYPRMFLVKYGGPTPPPTQGETGSEQVEPDTLQIANLESSVEGAHNIGQGLDEYVTGEVGIAYGEFPEPTRVVRSVNQYARAPSAWQERRLRNRPGYIPPDPGYIPRDRPTERVTREPQTIPGLWQKWVWRVAPQLLRDITTNQT